MSERIRDTRPTGVGSSVLWALWVLAFVVLEVIGLQRSDDDRYTLTNRVRALMRSHPVVLWVLRAAILGGCAWLVWHFLGVDPVTHPGAFRV